MTESMDVKPKDLTNPKKLSKKGLVMLENGVGATLDKYTVQTITEILPNLKNYPSAFGFIRGLLYGLLSGSIKSKDIDEILKGAFAEASSDFVMNLSNDIKKFISKFKSKSVATTPAPAIRSASVKPIVRHPIKRIYRPVGRRRFWR